MSSKGTCYDVPIRSLYVPIRSVRPLHFGFVLAPAAPPALKLYVPIRSYTFLYVPSAFVIQFVTYLNVPIRSVQPSRNSVT
jgi:hypothetical protein